MPGKLYIIPNTISGDGDFSGVPNYIAALIAPLQYFIVEEEKSARRLLKKVNPQIVFEQCQFFPLSEHTSAKELQEYLKTVLTEDIGLISESGCPCVADPGAEVVLWAHKNNKKVIPLVGPSSIMLALMASGLNGQNFAFNGYLPKERAERIKKIKELEMRSAQESQTQIFMEAPYRNQNLFEDVISACQPSTLLSISSDLTGQGEYIETLPISAWKSEAPPLHKKPALFLIQGVQRK